MAVFQAEVIDLASDGRGVIRHPDGRTVFVPGVWLGEVGRFRLTGKKGSVAFAELVELIERSDARIAAPCAHHGHGAGHCGACPWQSFRYDAQLAAKQQRVEQAFSRIGVTHATATIQPIWRSEQVFAYRNRAQLKSDGKRIGFVASKSHELVAIDACPILSEQNQTTLQGLIAKLPNPDWRAAKKHQWTTLDIDDSVSVDSVSVNQRLPFRQANDAQNVRMREWLAERLSALPSDQVVLELFCGSGNLTEVIAAAKFDCIYAVEAVEAAISQLDAKKLDGVTSVLHNLFEEQTFAKLYKKIKAPDVLVLDPPRDGLKEREKFLGPKKRGIKKVFYISCDLMTLVRDVKAFQQEGFHVSEVQPLDQFPHTPHIELMVAMER